MFINKLSTLSVFAYHSIQAVSGEYVFGDDESKDDAKCVTNSSCMADDGSDVTIIGGNTTSQMAVDASK